MVRKELIEKVTFKPNHEGDEGVRTGHLGKNVPDRRLVLKYKRPEGRVCLACWRNHKEPSVSGKVYVRWGWGLGRYYWRVELRL